MLPLFVARENEACHFYNLRMSKDLKEKERERERRI